MGLPNDLTKNLHLCLCYYLIFVVNYLEWRCNSISQRAEARWAGAGVGGLGVGGIATH